MSTSSNTTAHEPGHQSPETAEKLQRALAALTDLQPTLVAALDEIRDIEAAFGVKFRLDGRRLLVSPKSAITEEVATFVRSHRTFIVDVLALARGLAQLKQHGDAAQEKP